jgi:carbamoylphosphate synthase small subunit
LTVAQLAISRNNGNPSQWCRELTMTEMLSDSIVQAVMEADGIDPRVLETQLRKMAQQLSAATHVDRIGSGT